MMGTEFPYGFRVSGDCRQPRRLVDADAAMAAYAACDVRCQLDRESYLSAFQFGREFREHLAATGSTAGFRGSCWASWLWLDIDVANNLERAREDTRKLVVAITDRLGVDEDELLIFFSGSKGFHIGISTVLWQPLPGADFHRRIRRFSERLAEIAGVTIDVGVYDKVRCFRAPNSKHPKTGLHKRYLSFGELMHLNIDAIAKLAERPAEFELPTPAGRSDMAGQLWAEAAEQVRRQRKANADRGAGGKGREKLNRATLTFIRDGASPGDRHRLCYSASANLAECGASLPLCIALLSDAALDCGLPPKDIRRGIENGHASIQPDGGHA